jgi:copper resistance protein B
MTLRRVTPVVIGTLAGGLAAGCVLADEPPEQDEGIMERTSDPEQLAETHRQSQQSHESVRQWKLMGDRLEVETADDPALVWDVEGSYGSSVNRIRFTSQGALGLDEGKVGSAELQVLYNRAVSPSWDLQMGLRHDLEPSPSRSYAVLGVQGESPFRLVIDAAAFISDTGDVSGSITAEYELRLSERLLLQPRGELILALSSDPEIDVGSGLNSLELGLRLRYEVVHQFAPYVGVSWSKLYGETADLSGDSERLTALVGVRFWL